MSATRANIAPVDPQLYQAFAYQPKISVIVPSYQQGEFLEENLLSILNQNYPHTEILVVDGGSTDTSLDVILKYEDRLAWWVSERDKGTYDADNKGLERMTGDYWLVLNSDDILLSGAFVEFLKILNLKGGDRPDWITGGTTMIDENSLVRAEVNPKPSPKVAGLTFNHSCWIYHPCTLLSRKIYQVVGRFAPTDIMDYDYWIRCEELGYFPVVIPKQLAGLRWHSAAKSFNFFSMYLKNKDRLEKQKNIMIHHLSFEQMQELDGRIKHWDRQYHVMRFKQAVHDRAFIRFVKAWFYLLFFYPEQVAKRWFWSATFRFFTIGLPEEDFSPLKFLMNRP